MLVEDPKTLDLLRRMIARLGVDRASEEDLRQEALLHLWWQEQRCPGQKLGWYLRGCWLRVMNILRVGRSIDCPKRHAGRVRYDETWGEQVPSRVVQGVDVRGEVSAHDLVAAMSRRLKARERETLRFLAEGLSDREIARRLHLSHVAVAKRRRKIAAVACRLGIQPPARIRHR